MSDAAGRADGAGDICVVVAGPDGRMGSVMVTGLPLEGGIRVVGGLRRNAADAAELLASADVLVDFTVPDSALSVILAAIEAGARPVSGTSGMSAEALATIDAAARAKGIPAIWANQFTPGGALMMHICRLAARYMESATIVEAHHATKADAPSGTAWELARQIRAAHGRDLTDYPTQHEMVEAVQGGNVGGVRVHALRMPGILGWNEVNFSSAGEVLTIRQTDSTRETFVPYVARAVREVMSTDRIGLIRGYGAVIGLDSDAAPVAAPAR
jgi:4-hydroxy-tetrahydrodipicolinate reductase